MIGIGRAGDGPGQEGRLRREDGGVLNGAILALMISVGHRTGLFDTWPPCRRRPASRSPKAAGLNERYVREWLAGDGDGGIVEYDRGRAAYLLPPEHAAFLTRAAGPGTWPCFTQYIADAGRGGGRRHRQLPQRRRRAVLARIRASRHFMARRALRFDHLLLQTMLPLVAGLGRAAERGHRRARHRLRPGPRRQPDGARVPEQPLHRLRLLGGGRRGRRAPRRRRWASRTRRFEARDVADPRRPRHATTSSPRSTSSTTRRSRAECCAGSRERLAPGRHLPDGGRRGLERARRTTSSTRWDRSSTRCLDHPLHDGLAGPGRGGAGHGLGRAEGAVDAAGGGAGAPWTSTGSGPTIPSTTTTWPARRV